MKPDNYRDYADVQAFAHRRLAVVIRTLLSLKLRVEEEPDLAHFGPRIYEQMAEYQKLMDDLLAAVRARG